MSFQVPSSSPRNNNANDDDQKHDHNNYHQDDTAHGRSHQHGGGCHAFERLGAPGHYEAGTIKKQDATEELQIEIENDTEETNV